MDRKIANSQMLSSKNISEQQMRDQLLRTRLSYRIQQKNKLSRRADIMLSRGERSTNRLSSLVARMNEQVEQSERTTASLIQSSSILKETHSVGGRLKSTIKSSGKLLSKYARRETTDKILIALALCFYFGVILYILKKRVGYFDWIFYSPWLYMA